MKIDLKDLRPLMDEAFKNGNTFSIYVHGTSMRPLFNDETIVELKQDFNISKGDIVFYQRDNGQYVLHRIKKINKDSYNIVGDHQYKIEKNVNKNNIIAKVVSYTKKEKKYYLNNFKYKIYKFIIKFGIIRYLFSHLT